MNRNSNHNHKSLNDQELQSQYITDIVKHKVNKIGWSGVIVIPTDFSYNLREAIFFPPLLQFQNSLN